MSKTSWDMDDALERELEAELQYGDKKKDVYNQAVRMWLKTAPHLDDVFERSDPDRVDFVEAAVKKEIERVKENPDYEGPNGDYSY